MSLMRAEVSGHADSSTETNKRSGSLQMNRTSGIAIASLAAIALVAATPAPTLRGSSAGITIPDEASIDRANTAPIILAQGRCYNGRCY
jgi:hypothetical protein